MATERVARTVFIVVVVVLVDLGVAGQGARATKKCISTDGVDTGLVLVDRFVVGGGQSAG
jgi:hypothetical protein